MDPLTQGLLGAAAAQAGLARKLGWRAAAAGFFGGVLADIDVLIFSTSDPLLSVTHHRHFTHALLLIPVGGLAAGLVLMALFPGFRRAWKPVLLAATLGYATHGVLDACTSYGTLLLWPFSSTRIAWDAIAIVDPVFTLALLAGVGWSLVGRLTRPARLGLMVALLYMGLGFVQHHRAIGEQERLAAYRQHTIVRGRAMPTLGNLLVWRSVYQAGDGRLYADSIRLSLVGDTRIRAGSSAAVFGPKDLPPAVAADARLRDAFERFAWFADGYVARIDSVGLVLGDMRYTLEPASLDPLWALRLAPGDARRPVAIVHRFRDRRGALRLLWQDLLASAGGACFAGKAQGAELATKRRSDGATKGREEEGRLGHGGANRDRGKFVPGRAGLRPVAKPQADNERVVCR